MNRIVKIVLLCLCVGRLGYAQTGFNGTWVTNDFKTPNGAVDPNYLELKVDGTKLTGVISRPNDVDSISEGTVAGDTITFKVTVANGGRVNSYTGKLAGNSIAFTRTVKVRDEAANNGAGIYGAGGPMQFTAKRDATANTPMGPFYGNWKLNVLKSKYTPGPAAKPQSPQIQQFGARGNGMVGQLFVSANELGTPTFSQVIAKVDGKEYPVYNPASLATLAEGGKPNPNTISMKAIDARTVEVTQKANGSVTGVTTLVVSADGRTLTETTKVLDAQGKQTATNVTVYDRVP